VPKNIPKAVETSNGLGNKNVFSSPAFMRNLGSVVRPPMAQINLVHFNPSKHFWSSLVERRLAVKS